MRHYRAFLALYDGDRHAEAMRKGHSNHAVMIEMGLAESLLLMGQTAMAYFVASLAVGLLCELTARVTRMATTLFLVSAIIPLVPGLGLYRTIMYIAEDNFSMALSMGVETVTGIGAIALSLTIATTIFSNIRLHVKPDSPPT